MTVRTVFRRAPLIDTQLANIRLGPGEVRTCEISLAEPYYDICVKVLDGVQVGQDGGNTILMCRYVFSEVAKSKTCVVFGQMHTKVNANNPALYSNLALVAAVHKTVSSELT